MPSSVPTAAEFTAFGKQTSDAIAALDARIKKLETPPVASNIYDDFKYSYDFKNGHNSPNGKWIREYDSNGFIRVENGSIVMQPGGSTLTNMGGSAKVN